MSPKAPPFGLPVNTRTAVEDLNTRVSGLEDRFAEHEADTRERMARVETKVDVLVEMAREDREAKNAAAALAITEQGKTTRIKLTSRAKIVVALCGLVGVAIGAAATVLAGCV